MVVGWRLYAIDGNPGAGHQCHQLFGKGRCRRFLTQRVADHHLQRLFQRRQIPVGSQWQQGAAEPLVAVAEPGELAAHPLCRGERSAQGQQVGLNRILGCGRRLQGSGVRGEPEIQIAVQGPIGKEVYPGRQEQRLLIDTCLIHHFAVKAQALAQAQAVPGLSCGNGANGSTTLSPHRAEKHGEDRGDIIEVYSGLRMVWITAGGRGPTVPVTADQFLEFQQVQHVASSAMRPNQSEPKAIAITSSRASWTSGSSVNGSTSVARVACMMGIPEAISVAQ